MADDNPIVGPGLGLLHDGFFNQDFENPVFAGNALDDAPVGNFHDPNFVIGHDIHLSEPQNIDGENRRILTIKGCNIKLVHGPDDTDDNILRVEGFGENTQIIPEMPGLIRQYGGYKHDIATQMLQQSDEYFKTHTIGVVYNHLNGDFDNFCMYLIIGPNCLEINGMKHNNIISLEIQKYTTFNEYPLVFRTVIQFTL
jgi:hypothetical protein